MEYLTSSCQHTQGLAHNLGRLAVPGTVLILDGPLGAGKTSFVQGLARGLGITGIVNSPTFTLMKEYEGRLPLYHFDLYRLEDPEELWELGFEEYIEGGGVCAMEWGHRVLDLLPQDHLTIRLRFAGDNKRLISFFPIGEIHRRLAKELRKIVGPGN